MASLNNALLLATLPNLCVPHFLTQVIAAATIHTRHRLLIVLFSRHFNSPSALSLIQGLSHTTSWDPVQHILTFTYVQATKVAWNENKIQMKIDVLLKGLNEDLDQDLGKEMDIVFRVAGDSIAVPLPESIALLRQSYLPAGEQHPEEQIITTEGISSPTTSVLPPFYPVSVIGGTFDHLHAGHKILLSMAAHITTQKLIVGITDDALLQNKVNKHILQNINVRSEQVRNFLKLFKPSIIPDITPIVDVYGPTSWDPNIQALVVSKETISGAEAIASHRQKHNLPPLQVFLIDVISATHASLDHEDAVWLKGNKLSSTFIRQWIVDNEKQAEKKEEVGQ